MILARPQDDLTAARARIQHGQARASELFAESVRCADDPACQHVFLRRFDAAARSQAAATDAGLAAGAPVPALAGLAVSVKDLFDVAGQPTTGGSVVMGPGSGDGPATRDCPAVERLRRAGAALIGHTNLTEFAFSGVGINPHHGTPLNPATRALDPTPRIPGGSTSGGGVSVAAGAAWAALGSDTGGSIRIPAALQGLVGFKNTQRLTPLDGAIPLSTSLDTACAITRSVRDAIVLHEVLSASRVAIQRRTARQWRLAVPTTLMLDGLDTTVARAFESALSTLRAGGIEIHAIALPALDRLATINAQGGLSAAESWAWHRERLAAHGDRYDPRVALRIRRGAQQSAADYLDLLQARRAWVQEVEAALQGYDALVAPTVPMVAPPLAPLVDDDAAFFSTNALLLRNPSVINFLDGCSLSLPCHAPDDLPVGLMLSAPALNDDRLLSLALVVESLLGSR